MSAKGEIGGWEEHGREKSWLLSGKRGRTKKHESDKARKEAYRKRAKAAKEAEEARSKKRKGRKVAPAKK